MNTGEATFLLAATAALWVLLFVANAIQDGRIIRRLRDHNSATWQRLGRPSSFRLWNRSVGSFLKGNEHHQLGDTTLIRMVAIQRVLGWAHLAAFLAFLTLMLLGPDDSPSGTFQADRNAFLNPGGANQHFNIRPPPGMSPKAFAEGVIRLGDSYEAARYSNFRGPNSNSAAAFPLHVLGATVPSIPRTPWLNYFSDLRPR